MRETLGLQVLSCCNIIDRRQFSFNVKIIHPGGKFRRRPNSFSLPAVLARKCCKSNLNLRGINTRLGTQRKRRRKTRSAVTASGIIKRSGLILLWMNWRGAAAEVSLEDGAQRALYSN